MYFKRGTSTTGSHIVWSRTRDQKVSKRTRIRSTHTNLRMPVTINDKVKFASLMRGSKFVPQGYSPETDKIYVMKPRHESNSVGIRFTKFPETGRGYDVQEFVSDIRTFRTKKFVARFLYLWVPVSGWRITRDGPIVIADEPYSSTDFRPEVQLPSRFVHDTSAAALMNEYDQKCIHHIGQDLFDRLETLGVQQAAHKTRFDIYGLDFLFTSNGISLLEVNTYFSLDWGDSTPIIANGMQQLFEELLLM